MATTAESPFAPWRIVPLERTLNARDIGGYPTHDGCRVVRGRIFRSAELAQITPSDVKKLVARQIDTVVDFRGPKEAADSPDRLPAQMNHLNSPVIGSVKGDDIDQHVIENMISNAGLPVTMLDQAKVTPHGPYYRMLYLVSGYGTDRHLDSLKGYQPLFQTLLALPPTSNILCHCTGGRDRTGVGTALLLKTLGVPDYLIEADFVASNVYLQPDREDPDSLRFLDFRCANVFLQPSTSTRYQKVAADLAASPDQIRGAVELRPELLRRMFAAIDARYTSFDTFLEQVMSVGLAERQKLKELYTTGLD